MQMWSGVILREDNSLEIYPMELICVSRKTLFTFLFGTLPMLEHLKRLNMEGKEKFLSDYARKLLLSSAI